MNYETWIERERKIRLKLITDGLKKSEDNIYRVCRDCDEVCLCHEARCPNCDSSNIEERHLMAQCIAMRIRCRYRYANIRVGTK
jgi:hypothetical protein